MSCSACGAAIATSALRCPACHRLSHSADLEVLAKPAGAAWRVGDFTLERTLWAQSLALLPEDTMQHRTIQARIDEIDVQRAGSACAPQESHWRPKLGIGAGGIRPLLVLPPPQGQFLLLGLT